MISFFQAQVYGVDMVDDMLKEAVAHQQSLGLKNLTWMQGDAYELPLPAEHCDIVTCRLAFHHMPQPERALQQMLRVCRKGGKLCDGLYKIVEAV